MFIMVKVKKKKQAKKTKPKSMSKKKVKSKNNKKKNRVNGKRKLDKQVKNKSIKKVKRDRNGRVLPGQSSINPNGRPKRGETKSDRLMEAISRYQLGMKLDPRNPTDHFIRRSFKSDTTLIALMKKLYPDLKSIEQLNISGGSIPEEEMEKIRKEYRKRFEREK